MLAVTRLATLANDDTKGPSVSTAVEIAAPEWDRRTPSGCGDRSCPGDGFCRARVGWGASLPRQCPGGRRHGRRRGDASGRKDGEESPSRDPTGRGFAKDTRDPRHWDRRQCARLLRHTACVRFGLLRGQLRVVQRRGGADGHCRLCSWNGLRVSRGASRESRRTEPRFTLPPPTPRRLSERPTGREGSSGPVSRAWSSPATSRNRRLVPHHPF